MKKILFFTMILFGFNCTSFANLSFAEGAMNVHTEINSRIFSTQGAQPLETLERSYYTNQAIMQIEHKQKPVSEPLKKEENLVPVQEKKGIKGLFQGFRVIW